ncbi:hypothetical protein LAZ67_X000363 [Cordylochernes scorpioides]|uniref:Integrase catalytic domain-containing protein n=1 Tax=Cordylochernes scorpioides TaxID=51811 RepID=A0ABY6LVS1_9ARAC|nr:hypothetical protein LAZ67_X000363 [Cordylochernes scorpioides]
MENTDGMAVGGNFDDLMETQGCVNYTVSEPVNDNDLHELIKSSFSTENFGVIPRTRWQGINQVDERAYDILQKTTKRTGACWETGLLWRDAEGTLPESYQMALGRLRHTERKLAKDTLLLAAYKAKFDEYQEKEYIRKLDSIEVTKRSERTWYIRHFSVTNPKRPGKLRLVFDAAARSNGVSLNEALSKGLDLIRPLTSVLWNFRVHNIARNGNITTTLFGSKARVAPLKKLTIPKLEIQGCVLGTRLAVLLRSELRLPKVGREVFWSNSKTVLAWIRSEAGRYKEFVANRVGEIQEALKGTDWRWVPTSENPADIATRFEAEISFKPTDIVSPSSDVECGRKSGKRLLPEKKFETFADIESCVMVVWKTAKLWRDKTQRKRPRLHRPLTRLLNLEDFSSLNRLVCRAAAVQKAARFRYKKTFHKSGELNPPWKAAMENNKVRQHSFTVSPEEYRSAVTTLVQWVQTDRILQANKGPAEQKTPAILPSDHHVTELLIQAEHERCAHQGSETLLNNLRGRFWIIDGRQRVLRTIRKCPRCRLSRASPVIPVMGQLPHYRLAAYQRPFTFTGLDAFGPFTVIVGRRHEKLWVIIFTCLVTRAIHLEVVHAFSTDEFMMGLSRFIDTRGRPDTIYSDNGTNFVGASKELKLAASEIDIEVMAASGRFGPVKCKFNPPAAPHFGGAWERLIKSVKKCLRATLNEVNPKDTTLLTALKSAENIINSRPLTYVSSDPTEEDSLTPNHFLRGANDAGPSIPKLIVANNRDLREQWKRAQQLTNEFCIK